MALTTTAATRAGNGLGSVTYIYEITTATISVEDAITAMTTTYGMTVAGVTGTSGGTEHVAAQGGAGGAEAEGGVALVATFAD